MTFQWIGIQLWTEVAVRSGYSWIAVRIFFYSAMANFFNALFFGNTKPFTLDLEKCKKYCIEFKKALKAKNRRVNNKYK